MTDVLIRDIPPHELARIDARAAGLGLSRGEYLRRMVLQDAARGRDNLTEDDLMRFAELSRDLLDDDIMSNAWR